MIQLHDSVLLLSEFPCFSKGLRHVRNHVSNFYDFGDIDMSLNVCIGSALAGGDDNMKNDRLISTVSNYLRGN